MLGSAGNGDASCTPDQGVWPLQPVQQREEQLCGIFCGGAISSSSYPRAWLQRRRDRPGDVSDAWLAKRPGHKHTLTAITFPTKNS